MALLSSRPPLPGTVQWHASPHHCPTALQSARPLVRARPTTMAVSAKKMTKNRFLDLSMDEDDQSYLDLTRLPNTQAQQGQSAVQAPPAPAPVPQQGYQAQTGRQQQQPQQPLPPVEFDMFDDWGPLLPLPEKGSGGGGGGYFNPAPGQWSNSPPQQQQQQRAPYGSPYNRPQFNDGGGYGGNSNGGYLQSFPNRSRNNRNLQTYRSLQSFDDGLDDDDGGPPPDPLSSEKRMINGKELLCNRNIPVPEVFVIAADKTKLGVLSTSEALDMAVKRKVDLVLINPDQKPPIARLIKWDRYKFELEMDSKAKKAGSNVQETKEVRLRPTTDTGDVAIKVKAVSKFLSKGNRVKITMRFEGRELQFKEQGKETLLKFIEGLGEAARVDGPLNFKTGTYTVMLVPTGKAVPA